MQRLTPLGRAPVTRLLLGVTLCVVASRVASPTAAQRPRFVFRYNVATVPPVGELNSPRGLALRPDESLLYVVDGENARVQVFDVKARRFVQAFGARGGGVGQFWDPQGVAVSRDGRMVYVTDAMRTKVQYFDVESGYRRGGEFGGHGLGANFFYEPHGIAIHADGRILVVDRGAGKVQIFDSDHSSLGFIGGSALDIGTLGAPADVAIDPRDGSLWVSETDPSHRVLHFTATGNPRGNIGCQPGMGCLAEMYYPTGVAVGTQGLVFVHDREYVATEPGGGVRRRLRSVEPAGTGLARQEWLLPPAPDPFMRAPLSGVAAAQDGGVFTVNSASGRLAYIQDASQGGRPTAEYGLLGRQPGQFTRPGGVALHGELLVVADTGADQLELVILGPDGFKPEEVRVINNLNLPVAGLSAPLGVAFAPRGDKFYVCDAGNGRVLRFVAQGSLDVPPVLAGGPDLKRPVDVAVDRSGHVYVIDYDTGALHKYDPSGMHVLSVGGGRERKFEHPLSITVGPDGRLYLLEDRKPEVRVVSPSGELEGSWGAYGEAPGRLYNPVALSSDGRYLYVLDSREPFARVQVFDPSKPYYPDDPNQGSFVAQFATKFAASEDGLWHPSDVAAYGSVVAISDSLHMRVAVWKETGDSPAATLTSTPSPTDEPPPTATPSAPTPSPTLVPPTATFTPTLVPATATQTITTAPQPHSPTPTPSRTPTEHRNTQAPTYYSFLPALFRTHVR